MRFDIGPVTAPTLTGLTAAAGVRAIVLTWDVPNDNKHAKTRVYYATVNNTAAATLVAEVYGNTFTHTGLSTSTRYYWVRSVNVYGREDGAWSAVASIGSTLLTELDIAANAVKAAALDVAGIDSATGKVVASQIAAGTLAAGVVYAGSVTAAQISASSLSAITANLGSVTAGEITGTANINITGAARFGGATTFSGLSAAVLANHTAGALTGILAYGAGDAAVRGQGEASSHGVIGSSEASSKAGVFGTSNSASGYGVIGENNNGGPAILCEGPFAWGVYTWPMPGGSSQLALLANGTWGTPHAAFATSAGETRNSSGASLWCNAHQAVMQTDGNFVVYNSGTPVGSSSGGFPSDARLKEHITNTAQSGLAMVESWRVVDYEWKVGTPMRGKTLWPVQTGFLAQEVASVTPNLVTAVPGSAPEQAETLLLNKTEMIPYMVKSIQELALQIRELKSQLNLA